MKDFWSQVDKSGGPNACWRWVGTKHRQGYGFFWRRDLGRAVLAHRESRRLTHEDPGQMHVLHRCDNTACVNPAHLFLGTHADNMRDCVSKGRHKIPRVSGARHGGATLNPDDADLIRRLYRCGNFTMKELATRYGVGRMTISRVLNGEHWAVRA